MRIYIIIIIIIIISSKCEFKNKRQNYADTSKHIYVIIVYFV